jgi:autotransporter-associated beta strand protein
MTNPALLDRLPGRSHLRSLLILCIRFCVLALFTLPFLTRSVRANVPGGVIGTSGTYPAVTLVTNSSAGTVTMSNGIVTAVIDINTAQVLTLTYAGYQVTSGGTGADDDFFWQGQNSVGEQTGGFGVLTVVANPATNSGTEADIMISDLYSNHTSSTDSPDDAYHHYTMFQGSPGLYVTEVMARPNTYPAGGADIPSFTAGLSGSPFNWIAQDGAGQNVLMPTDSTTNWVAGINYSPKEVTLVNSGLLNGRFNCKYNYSDDLGLLSVSGWCCNDQTSTPNIGIWAIRPSTEFNACGPKHPEIQSQLMNLNVTFKGVHFGFGSDLSFAAGETWNHVCGPIFIYLNRAPATTVVTGSNPALTGTAQVSLFADAQAQAAAEKGAWPYSWLNDSHWVPASGRGIVSGTLVISDSGNPLASASNMWIGVAQQPSSTESPVPTDFQVWGKGYQFWTKTNANGSFSIPNVIAGSNYTLFAFGPGAPGLLQSQALSGATPNFTVTYPATQFSATVTGGGTTNLGNVTFAPTRYGPTAWEIGQLDRDSTEYRHGQDYWHGDNGTAANPAVNWNPYFNYSKDFPNGLTYTVGQSLWQRDWDFAQPNVLNPLTANWQSTSQTIVFNLPSAPASNSTASLYLALSEVDGNVVTVYVNGDDLGYFRPAYPPGATNDCMVRMESHGIWFDHRTNFSGSLLHSGSNNIQIFCPQSNPGYFANGIVYDYLRLEVPGYVPPAPASLTALSGSSRIVLNWPPSPGATTYNILRSTINGSGYALLTGTVTGPICGSTPQPAAYIDTTASNGTGYYYVVQAVNPAGTSANSVQATGTASATAPAAPAAPTSLSITPGNEQALLTWKASTGASLYNVQRSITPGGPYTPVVSSVSGTSCTDTGLTNSDSYYYVVSAVNASGTSANSTQASVLPMPADVTAAPTGLTVVESGGEPYVAWNGVSAATNYVIQRATAPGGPYTVLYAYDVADFYADTTASPSTTYFYEVAAANLSGISAFTSPVSYTTPPAPPASLTASPGNTQITLTWPAATGAASYAVGRSLVTGGPYAIIATPAGLSYADTGLTNGTPYYYVVAGVNTSGTGVDSAEATATPVSTVPVGPTGLVATATNGEITLGWNASSGATGYVVYRAPVTGGPYVAIASGVDTTSYTDSSLQGGATWYYVVVAINASGASAYSNEASATTPPGTPGNLTATAGNTQVQLSWSAASGATSYSVQRSRVSGGPYSTLGSATGLSFTSKALTNGTEYFYVVAGVGAGGTGADSTEANATPTAAVPLAPSTFTATGTNEAVILNWNAPSGATSYTIYQASVSGGPYVAVATGVTATTYTVTGLLPVTTYYYVVVAANSLGGSVYSPEVSATTLVYSLPTLTWDALGASPTDAADGAGTWTNATPALWSNGATDSVWSNSGTAAAVFGHDNGAAGTVTVGAVTAGDLVFNTPGSGSYTLTSGTVTLSGSYPAITANAGSDIASVISGTGTVVVAGTGSMYFTGANTYTGPTVIAPGASLTVDNTAALQNSTLNYSAGTVDFSAATTAATLGGLQGTGPAQTLSTTNLGAAAVALTVGGNNATTTFAGTISGNGSLTKAGTGGLTIGNASYSGATTVNGGSTLTIEGGNFGSSNNPITVAVSSAAYLDITGGNATASTVNIGIDGGESNSSLSINGDASAAFGTVNLASINDTGGQIGIDTTGAVSLGDMYVVRDYGAGNGLVIQNGTVTAALLAVEGNSDRTGDMAISGGSLTIGNSAASGAFEIGQGGDGANLVMTGGALTYAGTDGLLMSTAAVPTTAAVSSGTATLTGITLNAVDGAISSTLTVNSGATLYLGNVGLVEYTPAGSTVTVTFGNATIGASAPWTSSATITLAGGNTTTFQTADGSGVPNNITLTGLLTGGGGLAETGGGILILSGDASYTGATNVAGDLKLTGTLARTSSVTIAAGGVFQLAGGSLTVSGNVTNNGIFKISGTPALSQTGAFINNGVLDLINGPQALPGDFTNNGTVLNASSVKVQQLAINGSNFSLTIQGYSQHTYQLQHATSLMAPITWTDIGAAQTGMGAALTFTDTGASEKQGFYKVLVSP